MSKADLVRRKKTWKDVISKYVYCCIIMISWLTLCQADSHTYGTKIFTFRTSGRLGPPVQPAGILCKAIVHDILRTLVKDESNPVHDLAQVSRFNLGKS